MTTAKSLPYLVSGVLLAMLYCTGKENGENKFQRQIAEAARDSAVRRADSTARLAQEATAEAAKARSEAQVAVRQSEALRTQTRASNAQASAARQAAEAALADSAASADSLRGRLRELVVSSRHDSTVSAARARQDSTTIAKLLEVVAQDSLALTRQAQSYAALEAQYQAEVKVAALYKRNQGGGWRKAAMIGASVYGACRWVVKCQ